MKKLFVILAIILFASISYADGWIRTSNEQSADAAITTTDGYFYGIMVVTDGTNAVTVSIYDNATTNSGTELIPTWTVTTSATDRMQIITLPEGVHFLNGIYVDVTTAGTVGYVVYYNNR